MLEQFSSYVQPITAWLQGRILSEGLAVDLSREFPVDGSVFKSLADACRKGVASGELASRGEAPLKWGRALKPSAETHHFSVDVVQMDETVGPHHKHPNGEIDMVIPLDPQATFDGQGEGWKVYGPNSSHSPTVRGGRAIILYLLPGGEIMFSST